ncbi:RNA-directed DNA polymerase, eukaryota, reverse transcriptase zinc-binding domain protein [Tanacetum coccineum]
MPRSSGNFRPLLRRSSNMVLTFHEHDYLELLVDMPAANSLGYWDRLAKYEASTHKSGYDVEKEVAPDQLCNAIKLEAVVAALSILSPNSLWTVCDTWQWLLDVSPGYSVASVRSLVDARTLDVDSNATRWIRCIPNKIKVFLWRLSLNKLPSRVTLDLKGIDVGSLLCPICHEDVESVNHIFFSCEMAKALWDLFAKWWELDIPFCDNISDWFTWLDSLKVSNKVRSFIEGVGGTLMWFIWNYRNHLVFSSSRPKKALLWDSTVSQSFLWISSRNPKFNLSWIGWLQNPLAISASL